MNPRQQRQCSRLAGLALLAVCYAVSLMTLAVPSARADGGSVIFERRDYAVVIHSDGDLTITEHWQVHFAGQSYHHAFLRLYLARTAGIDIGSVAGADPGSQQISQTTDQTGNPMRQVAWDFPPTQDATRTFDIPYTVHGALGVGAQYAWLDWHFLDGVSQVNMPIHTSEITLTIPPAGANEATIYEWSDTGSVVVQQMADQPARVLGQDLSANTDLEVEAVFPRAALDATVSRQPWQVGDEPPTLPTPRTGASAIAGGDPTGGGPDGGSPTGIPTTFESGPPPIPLLSGLAALFQQVCAGFLPLVAIGGFLLLLLRGPRGGGPRLGGPWGRGPWYGGPWGGGGFGGGGGSMGGGGGGGSMGGGGGGGSMGGGGGGGGASGFS